MRDAKHFTVYNRGVLANAPCNSIVQHSFSPREEHYSKTIWQYTPAWIQTKAKAQLYWDAALQTLGGHAGRVSSVAFSPDGRSVVSRSWDMTARLWDAATGAPLQTLEGYSAHVSSVAFFPDGRSVSSGSLDEMVRLWDTGTGPPLQSREPLWLRVISRLSPGPP